jgi:glycosyltransferase involved in cell wall biosynthesis
MRLLLREHGIPGGIETVNIHLVKELTELVDRVVWVMPHARLKYFQQILPPSDRLIYEPQFWSRETSLKHTLTSTEQFFHQKKPTLDPAFQKLRRALLDLRLNWLIRRYRLTHSFCTWLHVDVPRIRIPTGVMVMDVMWKHFPDCFGPNSHDLVDRRFCRWLETSAVLFPVSEATAREVTRFYPEYEGRTQVVPHGALHHQPNGACSTKIPEKHSDRPVFYYPARAGINKDHLTLFKACERLFAEGHDFDVILTGDQTDRFACAEPWNDDNGIETCRVFLQEKQSLFRGRIKPLGYCARSEVDSLYETCTAVVLPSAFEGFGLPLIEALEKGVEIICSDIAPYREQLSRYGCTDEVRLFPKGDAIALASEMQKILNASREPQWRKRSRSIPLQSWSWKNAAAAYVELLSALTPAHRTAGLAADSAGQDADCPAT